ncbi:MAG TPA: hypothetical protein VNI77_02650 [Nitrososphaera sp.]|nr:hypothetical protein [Nitrososphaera sp.]
MKLESIIVNPGTFERLLRESKQDPRVKSDSEKIRFFIDWCKNNKMEEVILRLSSETKGGWASNFYLDFTTDRIIITKKSFITKFADVGYVAGLAPYPYLLLLKDSDPSKIRKQARLAPSELVKNENHVDSIWYCEIEEIILRKGIETAVANMFGRAIVANFLSIKHSKGRKCDFKLPVNKNGTYEQVYFWVNVVLPSHCKLQNEAKNV